MQSGLDLESARRTTVKPLRSWWNLKIILMTITGRASSFFMNESLRRVFCGWKQVLEERLFFVGTFRCRALSRVGHFRKLSMKTAESIRQKLPKKAQANSIF